MPTFIVKISDGSQAEMNLECDTAQDAVSNALMALSDFVARRPKLPDDISITVMDADRLEIARIIVDTAPAHARPLPH